MTDTFTPPPHPRRPDFRGQTGVLVLADGTVFEGLGFGAATTASARSVSTRR